MASIQTNVNSLFGQENLRVNDLFQACTIARLTSGFRINSSGDDAAGLAIANKYRADISELTQGVRNANDGISALQIVDGGLNNISKTLDRLKTLATQSASTTFTGSRVTLNNEYQALLGEINRQASNVGLVSGGVYNSAITVYIGGGSSQSNAQVSIDLSGTANQVDSSGLGISGTNVAGGGTALTGNSVRLDDSAVAFLAGSATQVYSFHIYNNAAQTAQTVTATVTGTAAGLSGQQVIDQLNSSLSQYGITASIVGSGSDVGELQFGGASPFTVSVAAASGGNTTATTGSTAENQANYRVASNQFNFVAVTGGSEIATFQNGNGSVNVTFDTTTGATAAAAIAAINTATASLGIYAVADAAGTGISIQGQSAFSVNKTQAATTGSVFTAALGAKTVSAPASTASSTGNALAALSFISSAVANLGVVQGRVGTGQNKLQYAISLAQSQVTNFAAAESRIRDADVASEAANLTKAQVLQQASLAALAQANSAPQAVLALLRG